MDALVENGTVADAITYNATCGGTIADNAVLIAAEVDVSTQLQYFWKYSSSIILLLLRR